MKTNQTDLQDRLNGEIQRLADNIQDCENKVLERIYEGEETQKKDSAELRSALDEERMLRGQEAEILKKGMQDAVDNVMTKHDQDLEAVRDALEREAEGREQT